MRSNLPVLLAALAAASACKVDVHEPATPIPHVTYEKAPDFAVEAPVTGAFIAAPAGEVTVGERLTKFCLEIAAKTGADVRIGCLPVVTYDLRRDGPWVSELGVRLADEVASRLEEAGLPGTVLNTPEMDVRIQRQGLDKASFASLADVAAQAGGLDLDVVTFGTLKRENAAGDNDRDLLTLDYLALDVASGREVARATVEVASDQLANRGFFELSERESLWLPGR